MWWKGDVHVSRLCAKYKLCSAPQSRVINFFSLLNITGQPLHMKHLATTQGHHRTRYGTKNSRLGSHAHAHVGWSPIQKKNSDVIEWSCPAWMVDMVLWFIRSCFVVCLPFGIIRTDQIMPSALASPEPWAGSSTILNISTNRDLNRNNYLKRKQHWAREAVGAERKVEDLEEITEAGKNMSLNNSWLFWWNIGWIRCQSFKVMIASHWHQSSTRNKWWLTPASHLQGFGLNLYLSNCIQSTYNKDSYWKIDFIVFDPVVTSNDQANELLVK
jgi:hypothetical protein